MTSPLDALEAYKLPPALSDGTWIEIPGGIKIKTRLPSRYNEKFQMAWLSRINLGEIDPDDMEKSVRGLSESPRKSLRDAFVATCLIGVEGLEEMSVGEFADTYPLAVDAALEEAEKLAEVLDAKVESGLKNLKAFSSGLGNGKAKAKSTPRSKRKENLKQETSVQT